MCRNYEKIETISFAKRVKETLYYFNYHFGCEEEIMRETGYNNFEEHERDHSGFFLLYLDHVKLLESRSHFEPEEFARFLKDWLNSHIAMDTALGIHIKESHIRAQKYIQTQIA
jgi:hemerythrin